MVVMNGIIKPTTVGREQWNSELAKCAQVLHVACSVVVQIDNNGASQRNVLLRHFRQEPIKPKVPDEWVVDTGCQDSLVRLDPIVEEEADAADDDDWRFVSDEEEAEPEAPVCQRVGSPPGTPPVASSPVLPDLGQPASSHGPDYNPNPRMVADTLPADFVSAITEPPPSSRRLSSLLAN